MKSSRAMLAIAMMGAGTLGAAVAAAKPADPWGEPAAPGSARNRPSGSKPVPGGGAKERAKRIARMMDKNPDGVTVPCDVCGLPVDPRADACSHCG